jgi:hypothetical protein
MKIKSGSLDPDLFLVNMRPMFWHEKKVFIQMFVCFGFYVT